MAIRPQKESRTHSGVSTIGVNALNNKKAGLGHTQVENLNVHVLTLITALILIITTGR